MSWSPVYRARRHLCPKLEMTKPSGLGKIPHRMSATGKIEKAARDFESILVDQWLEQAEKSFATVPANILINKPPAAETSFSA